jgi:outer membrane protein OmpA-like peptidoglycan-associated protein
MPPTPSNQSPTRSPTTSLAADALIFLLGVTFAAASSACVVQNEPPPAAPVAEPDLAGGVRMVVADLARQLGPAADGSRSLAIDPLLDGRTGQQTHASGLAQQDLAATIPSLMPGVKVLPFDAASAGQSRLIATGTLTATPEAGHYRINVALSDRQSGIVVAQAVSPFREAALDVTPTRYYADSPSLLLRDRSVEGYIKTADTPAGKPADALYIDQIPTSALLSDALTAYNAEKWQDSLALYEQVMQRPDGQQLRTFNGVYLANVQLGHMTEAEAAFGKIAALGLATNNQAVKLLFKPGSTEFWPDPKINAVYPMWLRQIARAAQTSGSCLDVVGHTSPSGSADRNLVLSKDRASAILERLEQEAPGLGRRAKVTGVGSSENLVGSGADDATDALDRRVEFKVVACGT